MKPRNITILVMLLGLLLVAFAAGIAQTPAQGDQKKKTESCCSMESCCTGDSCAMKAEEGTTGTGNDNSADAKKEHSCCGESCDMNMKHDAKMKHENHDKKHDCCKAKQKDKNKKAA